MELTIHFHLVPRLRISRALPPFLYAFMGCTGRALPLYQKNRVFNTSSRKSFKATLSDVNVIYFALESSPCALFLTYCVTAFLHLLIWYIILHSLSVIYIAPIILYCIESGSSWWEVSFFCVLLLWLKIGLWAIEQTGYFEPWYHFLTNTHEALPMHVCFWGQIRIDSQKW